MMGLPLGFAQPLVLLGLLSLPVLWWLLRLIPQRPRRIDFPPTRLLFDIKPKEDTPARTPWWLTLLRLTLAALVILAAAGPLWNPPVATSTGAAPIALLIDDGFGAAASWDARIRTADDILARAEADNRGVAIVPLAEAARDISLQPPAAARVRINQIKPKPHAIERVDALPAITRLLTATPGMEVIWLTDGIDVGRGSEFVSGLARAAEGHSIAVVPANHTASEIGLQCMQDLNVPLMLHHCELRQHLMANRHLRVRVDAHVKTSYAIDEADNPLCFLLHGACPERKVSEGSRAWPGPSLRIVPMSGGF